MSMNKDMIAISITEYNRLREMAEMLTMLYAGGVMEWKGYDNVEKQFNEWKAEETR